MFDYRAGYPSKSSLRYYADFVWLPAAVGLTAWFDWANLGWGWGAQALAGFVLFTLVEYVVHRWLLHGPLWRAAALKGADHQRHHHHPQEHVVFPVWYIPAIFAVVWGLMVPLGYSGLFAGFALGAVWFFSVHHAMHHWSRQWPGLARYSRWHDLHHKDLPANYGITHPGWDRLFGTYMTEAEGRAELKRLADERQLSTRWSLQGGWQRDAV